MDTVCLLSSCKLFVFIQTYPAQSWVCLEELSQSIMRSLFLTVILAVWVYTAPHISGWHLSLNRCWRIFPKYYMPVHSAKGNVNGFSFKVSFQWFFLTFFLFLHHISGMLISCGCVGRGECHISSVSTKTLCSVRDPLRVKPRFCMNYVSSRP